MKDNDFELLYHLGKTNVVVDTLNRKTLHVSQMMIRELELVEKFKDLKFQVEFGAYFIICSNTTISSDFLSLIKEKQLLYPSIWKIVGLVNTEHDKEFVMRYM